MENKLNPKEMEALSRERIIYIIDNYCDGNRMEFSRRTGVGKSSISQYVNGTNSPGSITASKIGNAFGLDPMWVMGFDVPMNKAEKKLQELAEDKHDTDMLLKYFGMLNDKGRELALVYVKSLADMKDFQKESSVRTSTA